jgi:hypothetical protein
MEPREIWAPKQRFRSLELLLDLCDWSLPERVLSISCSDAIATKLKTKVEILLLYFGQLESIVINNEVVHRTLPVILDPPKHDIKLERVEMDLTEWVAIPLYHMKRD